MVIFNILLFLVVLGFLVIVHEFGHFIVAKKSGVKVEAFSIGFGPVIFKKEISGTEYRVSIIPLGGYVKLAGETAGEESTGEDWEFISKPVWKRFFILFAGPFFNYILAVIIAIVLFNIGMPKISPEIGEVMKGYPAEEAGIKKMDIIVEAEGLPVNHWEEIIDIIKNKKGQTIDLTIDRPDEGRILFSIKPKVEKKKNIYGQYVQSAVIGIYPSGKTKIMHYSFFDSFKKGINYIGFLTAATLKGIWNMIVGNISFKESAAGPLGIYYITTEAAKEGIRFLLNIIAVISMSLAVINLFPFPVLDGGHILFLIIEKIKGSPIKPKIQQVIMQAGMCVLIALMVYLLFLDFSRFN